MLRWPMNKTGTLLLGCSLLVACTSATDRAIALYNQQRVVTQRELQSCMAGIVETPAAKLIGAKANPLVGTPSDAQLADDTMITDEEIAAVNQLLPPIHECFAQFLTHFTGLATAYIPVYEEWIADLDERTDALLKKEVTWGRYNQQTMWIKGTLDRKRNSVRLRIDQEFAIAAAAEQNDNPAPIQAINAGAPTLP